MADSGPNAMSTHQPVRELAAFLSAENMHPSQMRISQPAQGESLIAGVGITAGGASAHCELLLSRSHCVAQHFEPREGHKLRAVNQGPFPDGAGFVE